MTLTERIPEFARRPPFWWAAFFAWFVVLFALSSFSQAPIETSPPFMLSDKVAHAAYFTAGSAALYWALTLGRVAANSLLAFAACLISAALVGWFDEWHQTFTPGRSGNDLGDWIADLVGGALGYLFGRLGLPLLKQAPATLPAGDASLS